MGLKALMQLFDGKVITPYLLCMKICQRKMYNFPELERIRSEFRYYFVDSPKTIEQTAINKVADGTCRQVINVS
jgi:hypothetical protein